MQVSGSMGVLKICNRKPNQKTEKSIKKPVDQSKISRINGSVNQTEKIG